MGQVVAGVKAKLTDALPGQIGTNSRWGSSFIESLILSAEYALCEKLMQHREHEVTSLVSDTAEYTLDQKFISIDLVEFSSDGTNYDWVVDPVDFGELDCNNRRWRDNTGSRPEGYYLLSAPGTPISKIGLYRTPGTVTTEKIRIYGHVVDPTPLLSDDVQYKVHVPYVSALLKARENPQEAHALLNAAEDGISQTRARFMGTYAAGREGYGF